MEEPRTVLLYEHHPEPPYLVREPGRVALVMPAVPRWMGTAVLSFHAACCVALTGIAVMVLREMSRAPTGPAPAGTNAILGIVIGLPVLFVGFLAFQVRGWLTTSRRPSVLEVRDNEFTWSHAGLWATKVRGVPLARVREVRVRGTRVFGTYWAVRVRVDFTGWWPRLLRTFFTMDPTLAEEAHAAFAAALAEAGP